MGFVTAGPNECIVVSGYGRSPSKFIIGGKVFVWPFVQSSTRIKLNLIKCDVETNGVYSKLGVPINVKGTAQVKIKTRMPNDALDFASLKNACRLFLSKNQSQVMKIAQATLEGHQRAVIGTMTVEEVYQDRNKFSKAVESMTSDDMQRLGLELVSYTIAEVGDNLGYLQAIGEKRTAVVQSRAKIGQADAKKAAAIQEAKAKQVSMEAQYKNMTEEKLADKEFKIKQAQYKIEVETKNAERDAARPLQTAKTNQKVEKERATVQVVNKIKDIQLAEQEILRVQRELEAKVNKFADAKKFEIQQLAEAEYTEKKLDATANAESLQATGKAEAYAIQAKGEALADVKKKKAIALQEYKGAAILDVVLKQLPVVAKKVAQPLSQVEKLTMIAGDNGDIGATRITNEVLSIMGSIPESIKDLTGVDLGEAIANAAKN